MPTASRRHPRPALSRNRSRNRTRFWGEATIVFVAYALFVVGQALHAANSNGGASDPARFPSAASSYLDQVAAGRKLLGVAPDGIKTDLTSLESFSRLIGRQPNVVEFYQGFTEPFDAAAAAGTSRTGALPLDSWGPAGANLADVAAGRDDAYIAAFADQVKAYGGQIALSVGHEMNAPWSSWWGGGLAEAPTFVAAWRRVHDIFAQRGAANVIWVWTVNIEAGGAAPPDAYYPGDAYVDWIGVDGYFHYGLPTSFDALFGPTLNDLRAHYKLPILVVETGALATTLRPAEIQSVFDAVLGSRDLIGFVWFDYNLQSTEGVDWRLDDDGSSLDVYRRNATAAPFALRDPVTALATSDSANTTPFYPGSAR